MCKPALEEINLIFRHSTFFIGTYLFCFASSVPTAKQLSFSRALEIPCDRSFSNLEKLRIVVPGKRSMHSRDIPLI